MGSAVISETESWESEALTDDELTDLALAADPDIALADDAVSLWDLMGSGGGSGGHGDDGGDGGGGGGGGQGGDPKLPEWYMPAPMAGARPVRQRWHRGLALLIIVSFLVIDGLGLCITYGQLVVA
jgi:hypothetical protein